VGVQIRIAGPAVTVGERCGDETADVDLPNPLRPGPGEQGMLLNAKASLTAAWWARSITAVVTRDCLRAWPRVFRDLSRQFLGVNWLPATVGPEELPGHLSPHVGPVRRRDRGVGRPSDGGVERRDALGHLDTKRAQVVVDHLERRPQPRHILKILSGEVGSFKLLLPQLSQRMQTAAEQGSHLPRRHRVPSGKSLDPVHAGSDPHPGDSPRSA
jgi:hypothetical protein